MENTNNDRLAFKLNLFTDRFINDYEAVDSKFKYEEFNDYLKRDNKTCLDYEVYFGILDLLLTNLNWDLNPVTNKPLEVEEKIEILKNNISNLYTNIFNLHELEKDNNYKAKLLEEAIKVNPMLKALVISFEGIDATGKQTISTMVKDFLLFMCDNNSSVNPEIIKINIPNYNIPSGIKIKEILEKGNYNSKVLQELFALNRKEVQNTILEFNQLCTGQIQFGWEYGQQTIIENKIVLFDRWTDSAVAFKVAKEVKLILDCETKRINELIGKDVSEGLNLNLDDMEKIILSKSNLLELLNEQYNFEHNILGLVRPDIKILCRANIEVIKERLESRSKALNIELDSHEKDLNYLHLVQLVYSFIFRKYEKINSTEGIVEKDYNSGNYKSVSKVLQTDGLTIEQSIFRVLEVLISPKGEYQTLINNNALLDYKLLQAGVLDPKDFTKQYIQNKYNDYWVDKNGTTIHNAAMEIFYPDTTPVSAEDPMKDLTKKYLALETLKEKSFRNFKTLLD